MHISLSASSVGVTNSLCGSPYVWVRSLDIFRKSTYCERKFKPRADREIHGTPDALPVQCGADKRAFEMQRLIGSVPSNFKSKTNGGFPTVCHLELTAERFFSKERRLRSLQASRRSST
eukprot:IDg12978t1